MSRASLTTPQAQRLVEARLGRQPQDMLEAAVVLEAWVGMPAREALGTGRALMRSAQPESLPSAGHAPRPVEHEGFALEAVAFVIAVIAIVCWTEPLATDLGARVIERGLIVALPLALALQWGLRSRYLGRPRGLALLGRRPPLLALVPLVLIAPPGLLLGLSGVVAGLLTLTWIGGTVMIRRGWSLGYSAAVVLATAGMLGNLSALAVLVAVAAVTSVASVLAMRAPASAVEHPAGRWNRALTAAAIGAGLGMVIVGDRTIDWSVGPAPALALLPSSVASFWGGYHLWQFQHVIPQSLSGVAAFDTEVSGLSWPPLRILLGAVTRLVLGTAALSAVLVAAASWSGVDIAGLGVLVGFGLVALATMLVSLLESVGRAHWAMAAVLCAIAGEGVVGLTDATFVQGAGLMVGASLAVVVALPVAIALLSRPARTLATSLWIS